MALIAAHLNARHSGGDSVAIGIYCPSSTTSIPPPLPFSPSLIKLMVSVDVTEAPCLLTEIPVTKLRTLGRLCCHKLQAPLSGILMTGEKMTVEARLGLGVIWCYRWFGISQLRSVLV